MELIALTRVHCFTTSLPLVSTSRSALGRVRDEVLKKTGGRQEPFVYGSLGGREIALVSTETLQQVNSGTPPKPAVDYDKKMEISFWSVVKDAESKDLLQTYLNGYVVEEPG